MGILLLVIVVLVILIVVGLLGFRVQPEPFEAYVAPPPTPATGKLPETLPPLVRRYLEEAIGPDVPMIHSAVISGRVTVRLFGLVMPARFRITHLAGQSYHHIIQVTWFRRPIMKVDELYHHNRARMALPSGVVENEPKIDAAANLGLWGESVWLPAIYATDPRLRWEPVDDHTLVMEVPFGEERDRFTVTFDPESGLLRRMEALRWKDARDAAKTRWVMDVHGWRRFHGIAVPTPTSLTWGDDRHPWSVWTVEDICYNADVAALFAAPARQK